MRKLWRYALWAVGLVALVHGLGAEGLLVAPLMAVGFTGVAAGSVTSAFGGQQYEYLPWNAQVLIAEFADTGDTFISVVFSGSDVLKQPSTMPILATAAPIIYPDHYNLQDIAARGDRIGLLATNNTGAVADFRANAILKPFA